MRLLSAREASAELDVSYSKVLRGIACGAYPHVAYARRRVVDVDALREILEAERASEPWITLSAAAKSVGCNLPWLTRRVVSGEYPGRHNGKRWLVQLSEIQAAITDELHGSVRADADKE